MRLHASFFIVLSLCLLTCFSCALYNKQYSIIGGIEERYYYAIIDFIHSEPKLMKKDNAFHVFLDSNDSSIIVMGDSNKVPLIIEIQNWSSVLLLHEDAMMIAKDTTRNKTLVRIDYSHSDDHPKIWFDEEGVQKSYRAFPDGILEYQDKVFFWYRSPRPQTIDEEAINVMYKHHYVDTLVDKVLWPNDVIDDGRIGVKYTFSNSDLRRFKKEYTH